MITQERLKQLLHYSPETGVFTRLITLNSRAVEGTVTKGNVNKITSYCYITLEKQTYMVHSLVILYMEGYYPEYVDHEDNDPTNNKYKNLRTCTQSQNRANSRIMSNNTSGAKGVTYQDRPVPHYRVGVQMEGKRIRKVFTISMFSTKEEAFTQANSYAINLRNTMHGEFANHG